jgi:hypothetical protein
MDMVALHRVLQKAKEKNMDKNINLLALHRCFIIVIFICVGICQAQQKGQYVPGQFGLNAGVVPAAGLTYANLALNYSASSLNDANGNHRPNVLGTYGFWVDENIFYFVPKKKILGASFAPYISLNGASGSLVADISGTNLGASGGGSGFADLFVQPVNLGWHLKRADIVAGYAFMAPTGRFVAGASDNVGSGYWGNNLNFGATVYVTKNRGTTLNLFSDWETHGQKTGTTLTPGKAFTTEWGVGQVLPLKKDFSRLLQLGLIGYDQWQVTASSGTIGVLPASSVPFYSVHAVGLQSNFILPAKNLNFFFKYLDEYRAISRPEGRTIAFGGSWTLRIPKPVAAPKP